MNIQLLMQQAQAMQEQVQKQAKKIQEELAQTEIKGEAGGGLVRITMTGKYNARRIELDASLLSEDKDVLEDLIAAAINDAVRRVDALSQEKMGGVTQGLNLPPGLKLPF